MAATAESSTGPRPAPLAGLELDRLTERQVVSRVLDALSQRQGGWIATPNVDICRVVRRDAELARLLAGASLAVADGMPLIWAARMRGDPLPERVTGASLIFSLSEAAAASGRSVYLIGGAPGVPEQAGLRLAGLYPGLMVAGADAPPVGFDAAPEGIAAVREKAMAAEPDIVFVGLGFPKQERLIAALAPALPHTWFLACGAAIPFAAGVLPRAPHWLQRAGLEWLFRLLSEPRRLARRYLVDDLPFAVSLLAVSLAQRLGRRIPPR
jgi:N-acetylglucosaminyldiphosphoundecaprenol N-acetyl-beta-D-mannosaminyltransferase